MPGLTDDTILTRILSRCPQCPTPVIKVELVDTVVDFYEFTLLKQQELATIDTIVDQATYSITLPTGFMFVQAMSAKLNKIALEQRSADQLDLTWGEISRSYSFTHRNGIAFGGLDEPTWREASGTMPRFFHFETDGKVRLVAIPTTVFSGTLGLVIRAALKPLPTLTSIDDDVWNDNYQTLIAGTLERILRQPEKAWSNMKLADYWGAQYEDGRQKQLARVMRSDTRNDRQVLHSRCYP